MSHEAGDRLTHVGGDGAARMVDVSAKPDSLRTARATGWIRMSRATHDAIAANTMVKGDVLAVARLAGIMGAKRTPDLVPLCHPLSLTDISVSLVTDEWLPGVRVDAVTRTVGR